MNAKLYIGNVQPNPKEFKVWVTDEGVIKTWNGQKWVEQSNGGDDSTGGATKPRWTGHADVEGLKAIGWTDEDIAYYQENGVNWNEEDDQYHKVPEDNIALYGVLTADNISTYKDKIVYLPKIDTINVTNTGFMFNNCSSLVSIPQLDTSNVTNMSSMFANCHSLVTIPKLDTNSVTNMNTMFKNCYLLVSVPQLDTSNVKDMSFMFNNCYSLVSIPQLDTNSVTNMNTMFKYCYSLVTIPQLDMSNITNMNTTFDDCRLLQTIHIKNLKSALQIDDVYFLTKESLLYIINNESATSAITITLSFITYNKYVNDADIVAALANHPNISIAK